MAKPVVMEYAADESKAIKAVTAVIARLGYTLKGVDQANGLVSFETGVSLSSWAGQSMSVHVMDVGDSVRITIGGTMKAHGAQVQVYDWGEAAKIAGKVFEQLDGILGPGRLVSGSVTSGGNNALAVVVLVVVVVAVLLLIAVSQA